MQNQLLFDTQMKTALPVTNLTNNQLVWKNKQHQRKLLLMLRLYNLKMGKCYDIFLKSLVNYCPELLESVPKQLILTFFIALCRSSFVQQRDQWNLQHQKCGTAKSLYQNVYGTVMPLSVLYLLRSRYSHAPFC